jgi:hypothetical protein
VPSPGIATYAVRPLGVMAMDPGYPVPSATPAVEGPKVTEVMLTPDVRLIGVMTLSLTT